MAINLALDFHATPAEKAEADRLRQEDVIGNGWAIYDLSVSCYVAACGEDGRPEEVHERRSNGTCRCGYNGPYREGRRAR